MTPGTRLGPYEVIARLGAGGMGEVYRARDTRLDRIVAIKVLAEAVAGDAQVRERFSREARAISQLTHPHICTLYDIGVDRERFYLVMECLTGETLAARLQRAKAGAALTLPESLDIAAQVADALAFAHRHHIVHRDLKPTNIMLTAVGAKLLDFGLAREAGGADTEEPTKTLLTGGHVLVGTLAYMAPEQIDGRADTRTDLFALGAVLYEMLAGRRPFAGDTPSALIAAIVHTDPTPIATFASDMPEALDRLVRRCLAKDPEKRWQSAIDLADELRWIKQSLAKTEPARPGIPARAGSRALPALIAGAVLAVIAFGTLITWRLQAPTAIQREAPVRRFTMSLPPANPLIDSGDWGNSFAISRNGQRLIYTSATGRSSRLLLRALDQNGVQVLAGTEGASAPFFSPDGEWVGFFAGGKLKRAPVGGGSVVTICDAPEGPGGHAASWGDDGAIVFGLSESARSGLFRVASSGGPPELITQPTAADGGAHQAPFVFDGGKRIAYTNNRSRTWNGALVKTVGGSETRLPFENAQRPMVLASGHATFCRAGTLYAAPWNGTDVGGSPTPVVEGIRNCAYEVSNDGLLIYGASTAEARTLAWVDRTGRVEPVTQEQHGYNRPRVSPDGRRLAVEIRQDERSDIYTYSLDTGAFQRITTTGGNSAYWTPDARRLVFRRGLDLYWVDATGRAAEELLISHTDPAFRTGSSLAGGAWTPDGATFAFVVHDSTAAGAEVWALDLKPTRQIRQIVQQPANQWGVRVSPDGRWLSYASDRSGQFEVFVQPLEQSGTGIQVSTGGGRELVWSRERNEVFYRTLDDRMMVVPFQVTDGFVPGRPRELFSGRFVTMDIPNYDVTADGRFLMVKPSDDEIASVTLQVVENWFEELRRLVPPKE